MKMTLGKLKSASAITHPNRLTLAFSHLGAQLLYCFPPLQTALKTLIQHSISDSRAKQVQVQGVLYLSTLPQNLSKINNAS